MRIANKHLSSYQLKVKNDLLDQLKAKGMSGEHFNDLVNDYIYLLVTKDKLQEDIAERGVRVEYNNGGGQSGFRKNDSCDMLLKYNQQMLKILDYLGIKPSEILDTGEEDERL